MQGTAQIKNIYIYEYQKKKLVCAMNDGMRTVLQVIKCRGFRRAVGVMTLIIQALPEEKNAE